MRLCIQAICGNHDKKFQVARTCNTNDSTSNHFEIILISDTHAVTNREREKDHPLHVYKTILRITHLEKVRFIKVNELKRTQVELFSFYHFMCAAANASEMFCVTHLANDERFLCLVNLLF